VRNRELTVTLAKVLRRPLILPAVPAFLLRTALGEFGNVLLEGQRVVPKRLLETGYRFRFATLEEALRDLIDGKT
jgi:NAD dependent epimerase/dehydratase family enzyme